MPTPLFDVIELCRKSYPRNPNFFDRLFTGTLFFSEFNLVSLKRIMSPLHLTTA